ISLLIGVANLLAFISLSAEVIGYFERAISQKQGLPVEVARLENIREFAISALWTIHGAAALVAGKLFKRKLLRAGALILLSITTIKLLAFDLRYYDAEWHAPIFNPTFMAFMLLIAALALVIRFYARVEGIEEGPSLMPVLIIAANLLAIVA